MVECLGHSATAYEAAKERLERRYGGQRCQINLYIEELDNFRPVRPSHAKEVDKLADLLYVLVINLKESMLVNYNRWVFKHSKSECFKTLPQWIIKETEFQTVAAEILKDWDSSNEIHIHSLVKAERLTRESESCVDYGRQIIIDSGFATSSSKRTPQNTGM